jgi:hypothetical protein
VVTLHVLLGEMVPKNIAWPVRWTAMLLVPPTWSMCAQLTINRVLNKKRANAVLRAGVEPKDELDSTVSTVQLSEMIPSRYPRSAGSRGHTLGWPGVADSHQGGRRSRGRSPKLGGDRGCGRFRADGRCGQALAQTGYSVSGCGPDGDFIGYLHIRTC